MGRSELSVPDMYKYVSTFLDDHFRNTLLGLMTRRPILEHTFKQASGKFSDIAGGIKVKMVHSDGG